MGASDRPCPPLQTVLHPVKGLALLWRGWIRCHGARIVWHDRTPFGSLRLFRRGEESRIDPTIIDTIVKTTGF